MLKGFILFFILFFVFLNSYSVELATEKSVIKFLKSDLDRDGIPEEIRLVSKRKNLDELNYPFDLEIKSKEKKILLENVIISNGLSCGLEIIEVGSEFKPFFAISQRTGRHSWTLILYSFDGEKISHIHTFFSNVPSISVEDIDNDGENEIVVLNRDLDSINQETDRLIETYDYDGNVWSLVSIYSTRLKKNIPEEEWQYLKPPRKPKKVPESMKVNIYKTK